MASSLSSQQATAEDVLRLLVGRRIIPSVEAGVVLVASMSQVIRDIMLRVRLGPGGVPLPDKGSEVCLSHTALFQRLPPQPTASAASRYHADVQLDASWLETYGLRQSRRAPKAPASVRRTDISGREAHDTLGRLFASAEHVRKALAAVFDAAAEIATGVCGMANRGGAGAVAAAQAGPPKRVCVTFPGLGTLVVDRASADFLFSAEVQDEAAAIAERSQPRSVARGSGSHHRQQQRWGGGSDVGDDDGRLSVVSSALSRPGSACGSALSLLSRCSSSSGVAGGRRQKKRRGDVHAADENALSSMMFQSPNASAGQQQPLHRSASSSHGGSASIASLGSRSRAPSSSSFRRPNSTALQRAMDSAIEKELAAKRDVLESERRFATRSMQRADLAAIVDVAERKKKAGERSLVLEQLAAQIEERRSRDAVDQSERRAPTPLVFPFSDQKGMADRTRRLAQEQCSVNEAFAERHRAVSRNETRREWADNAQSAARTRSDAAREFLDAATVKRQQREELQDAWRAQIALKHAVSGDN